MARRRAAVLALAVGAVAALSWAGAAEPSPAERGYEAMVGRSFNPATMSFKAYKNAWRRWGAGGSTAPDDYDTKYQERYGLHAAPYPNNSYPMGLREAGGIIGTGLSTDCLLCHGGSIFGQSIVGLGNASLDLQAFYEDMAAADGRAPRTPFRFSNVRGTSEAGGMAVFLLGYREPDLMLRLGRLDLGLHDEMCEDTPAWWLLKKKKTMYHTGGGDARSVRSLMQFMLSPLNPPSVFEKEEATFRDVQAWLRSLQPPKYPLPIDKALAAKGETLFGDHCAKCHGTYGEKWTYPNKIVSIYEIGTDQARYNGISAKFEAYYNKSWFGQEYPGVETTGYQAPPLDGLWATAPYFHNGSAPTVYHVLNSKTRPQIFTRSYRTGKEDYDAEKLGWKVQVLDRAPDESVPAYERRKVYDTREPGRGNGGHTYGDKLSEEQRRAVIEYLKTI
jgi:mono/diheme cytochrome c family protein